MFYFNLIFSILELQTGSSDPIIIPEGKMQEDIFDNLDKTQQARGTGVSLHVGNVKV